MLGLSPSLAFLACSQEQPPVPNRGLASLVDSACFRGIGGLRRGSLFFFRLNLLCAKASPLFSNGQPHAMSHLADLVFPCPSMRPARSQRLGVPPPDKQHRDFCEQDASFPLERSGNQRDPLSFPRRTCVTFFPLSRRVWSRWEEVPPALHPFFPVHFYLPP